MRPKYLSLWIDPELNSDALAREIENLFARAQRPPYLIYEEDDGTPHHSERPILSDSELAELSEEIAGFSAFKVIGDMSSFIVIPIAFNEVVVIHDGSLTSPCDSAIHYRDSTETYSTGDWFDFIGPEISIITAK